jgi:predicted RNA-binding protein YlqC (UPF0109 family)
MAQTLVDVPGLMTVRATKGQHAVILEVKVAPTDVGKLIGKQGRIADALRTILSAAAAQQGAHLPAPGDHDRQASPL